MPLFRGGLTIPIRSDSIAVDRVGTINDRIRTSLSSLSLELQLDHVVKKYDKPPLIDRQSGKEMMPIEKRLAM